MPGSCTYIILYTYDFLDYQFKPRVVNIFTQIASLVHPRRETLVSGRACWVLLCPA
jgi:hypothetical protein